MPQTKTQKRETVLLKLERDLADLKTEAHRDRLLQHYSSYDNPVEFVRQLMARRENRMTTEITNLKRKLGKE